MIFVQILLLLFFAKFSSGGLRSKSELTSHCYHFPGMDFGYSNNVKYTYKSSPKVILTAGSNAIDFSLLSDKGTLITLSTLLKDKPVVLIWGHYTCPAWQGLNSDTMFLYSSHGNESAFAETYKNKLTVVHLISLEPHPIWPRCNFDSGNIRLNLWSTIPQPQTFAERMSYSVPPVKKLLNNNALLLVDYLDGPGEQFNNPVWCSYAHGARSAILISQEGVVTYTQDWFNAKDLAENVDKLLLG